MSATVTLLGTPVSATSGIPTFTTAVDVETTDAIVLGAGGNLAGSIALTITDPVGNTWTDQTESPTSSAPVNRTCLAVCRPSTRIPAGSTITCQVASGARGQQGFIAARVTGCLSSPIDSSPTPTASGSSGTTVTWPATGTLAQADEVAILFHMGGTAAAAISGANIPSGYSAVGSVNSPGARTYTMFSKILSSTTTTTPTGTQGASTSWAANLITLKIDTTPPPSGPDVRLFDVIPAF